jgi:hypothetical protein
MLYLYNQTLNWIIWGREKSPEKNPKKVKKDPKNLIIEGHFFINKKGSKKLEKGPKSEKKSGRKHEKISTQT